MRVRWGPSVHTKAQNFKIISELENFKQGDVKDEAKEKHLEEVSQYKPTEATMLLEKSSEARPKGKLNPFKSGLF